MLVGYGHCLATLVGHAPDLNEYSFFNYFGTFMYGFRMPLFFIVSGMLISQSLQKKGMQNYIADRMYTILYPLLVWGFIEISLQILASSYTSFTSGDTAYSFRYVQLLIDPRKTGHFWYLNALFCIGVIYALLKAKLRLGSLHQFILGVLLYIFYAFTSTGHIHCGVISDICQYYIFFSLGDVCSRVLLSEKSRPFLSSRVLFIALATAFLLVQYHYTTLNLQHNSFSFVETEMPFSYLFESLLGCAASMSFSFLLQRYRLFGWIRYIGRFSLYIYLMQVIVMAFARTFLQSVLHISYVPALIFLIWTAGTFLPILFYNLSCRYRLWWLYTFRKPKEETEMTPAVEMTRRSL